MGRTNTDVVGVILAGGQGTRMAPFSRRLPKPILPVCNRPLLDYQLESMQEAGIKECFVVVGHLGYEISLALGSGAYRGMRIHYVEQAQTLGIAHALGQLQPYVRSPFLLFLGDIFFRTTGLAEMVDRFRSLDDGSVLVVREDKPEAIQKNFAVVIDPGTGHVRRVIEKPRYLHNNLKGCGLYLFDLTIFDAIRRTPRTAMRDEYELTDAIQILIEDGERVELAHVVEEDINLTTPADLLRCNLLQLERLGQGHLIDPSAMVDPRATIHRSIIGPGVAIRGPVQLDHCVVFANTVLANPGDRISHHVFAPDVVVDCRPLALAG
jgi:dTDP-glucose pyrophosphorylase